MRIRVFLLVSLLLGLVGCGNDSSTSAGTARDYSGTASVGDFLSISLDPVAMTLNYTNHSNGDTGTVPYTVNSDGSYTLNDPSGNLVAAYEVPNFGLLIEANKVGPGHATPALITAMLKSSISLAAISGQDYNYLQFRTAAGGVDTGHISIDASGNVQSTGFWPYGLEQGSDAFTGNNFSYSQVQQGGSGTYMTLSDAGGNGTDYIFAAANGGFIVDTPNGAIVAIKQAASGPAFDPSVAGTYNGAYYQKTNVTCCTTVGNNTNVEMTGTVVLGQAVITIGIDANGNGTLSATNSSGTQILPTVTLQPVGSQSILPAPVYSPGNTNPNVALTNQCSGMFVGQVSRGAAGYQDIFVTFMPGAVLFGNFRPLAGGNNEYNYLYGVAMNGQQ
ncbi:MAG: hypothetical protein ABSD96_19490 [Candidatus Korobacteraceae bacterium]